MTTGLAVGLILPVNVKASPPEATALETAITALGAQVIAQVTAMVMVVMIMAMVMAGGMSTPLSGVFKKL